MPTQDLWQGAKTLRRDGEYVLFRRTGDRDADIALVVATASEQPPPRSVERLKHEFELRDSLDPDWAAKPLTLTQEHGRSLLVLADPGGELLTGFLDRGWETGAFLRASIGIAVALGHVHAKGLVHKDVKPDHVLIDPASGAAWLTGFGIASRLTRERQALESPEMIVGTLPYMAPEQTGRMNRSIDIRTDLYSLGVVFYEMLTGSLPFSASDPMEWVHCHIARHPAAPKERVTTLPAPISAIVLKLLEKNAEDRYQTAVGLEADLQRCLSEWETQRDIKPFPLGSHDVSDRLLIPERLYGRESQIESILAAFDRVVAAGAVEIVLISGYAGIGKSSVVNELHKALVPPRAFFAGGKFDQYKRDIPYVTLAQAFQSLTRQLLSKDAQEISQWRERLLEALGTNGQLLSNLIPELALIIGEQAPVPQLSPQEGQNRFQRLFRRFVGVFARPEHPLALFLDDLQWLDTATLEMLEHLGTHPEVKHLLLVGAYRDNEVDPSHPLRRILGAIRAAGRRVQEIDLTPLTLDDVTQMVAESLDCTVESAQSLACLIHEKTDGNPFFAIQLFSTLKDEELLQFNHRKAAWFWDVERIRSKGFSENVIDLMAAKLGRLSSDTQRSLGQLACLGNITQFSTMALVQAGTEEKLHADLWEAVSAGLILRASDAYKFVHDRVHEAAYGLIPESERAAAHLRIGRILSAKTAPEALDDAIFDIVNHLNRGAALIDDAQERERVVTFNLIAGKQARLATAYASARNYLAQAAQLLAPEAWTRRYAETFELYLSLSECEYLVGNFSAADALFDMILDNASSNVDGAKVHTLRIKLCQVAGKHDEGLAVAFRALRSLGVTFPDTDEGIKAAIESQFRDVPIQLAGRSIADLVDAPVASDPAKRAIIDLLVEAGPCAYNAKPPIFPLVAVEAVNRSIRDGNTDHSGFAYCVFALALVASVGNMDTAFQFSEMSLRLNDRFDNHRLRGPLLHLHGDHVNFWRQHFATGVPILKKAFTACLEVGDLVYGAYLAFQTPWQLVEKGDPLDDVTALLNESAAFAKQSHNNAIYETIRLEQRFIASLQGRTADPLVFSDDTLNEAACLATIEKAAFLPGVGFLHIMKQMLAMVYCRYPEALAAAARAESVLPAVMTMPIEATYYFCHALTLTALYPDSTPDQQAEYRRALEPALKRLLIWAENCPANYQNRHALVAAEVARIDGRDFEAMRLYEKAIQSAQESDFVHNEALANELAARFYLARGFEGIGVVYLRKARHCYLRWGAYGKVRQLDETFPGIREEERATPSTSTIRASVEGLDLATVIKVSQALSSEIVLEKMLDTLMRLAIANAGAGRGLLMLARRDEHSVVAEVTADRGSVDVQLCNHSVAEGSLPQSVYHYVLRTHESVILDDAAAQGPFTSDPYVREQRARSILCLPLLKQATLIGVLYLENPLAAGAFTPARIAVLDLLASQAAIALENARLYADLQKAHRLEGMGTLAGGIAHDFNNILGAILGYGEMALRQTTAGTQLRSDLAAILAAGERGRALVERVLAFSRSGMAERVAVHVEKVVREALDQLAARFTASVRLDVDLSASNAALLGDSTQVHQVVMNLGTNAAQAMPNGGVLAVTLRLERMDTTRAATIGGVEKGDYIVLGVADTGPGIPADVVERIFEPFFTTKEAGVGTGLGLSLVHSIVTQLGGAIDVVSAIGKGSTFTVYLPRSGDATDTEDTAELALPRGQGQCVMVVDDEQMLVDLAARTLAELGYVAVGFTSSTAALAAFRADPQRFDAVITDERMPQVSGAALIKEVRDIRNAIPVVLMSGFVGGGLMSRARAAGADEVLKKPLLAHDLAMSLARVLHP